MLNFLRTMSIKNKIKTLSFFFFLFIIGMSFYIDMNLYNKQSKLVDVKEIINLNEKIFL